MMVGFQYWEVMEKWLSIIFFKLLLAPKLAEVTQRHALFQTRCTIKNKVCDVMMDSGSTKNIVSKVLVQALELETHKHPQPYKIGWIEKGSEVRVHEICRVPFSIGQFYQDEITCDVDDMDACQILLGKPWQHDVNSVYKGQQNAYIFEWKGKKIALLSSVYTKC